MLETRAVSPMEPAAHRPPDANLETEEPKLSVMEVRAVAFAGADRRLPIVARGIPMCARIGSENSPAAAATGQGRDRE